MHACVCVCMHVCVCVAKPVAVELQRQLLFLNYLPLKIWTLKICNHYISKIITARSFKLGHMIEDDE